MTRIDQRLLILPDGRYTVLSGKMEYGQGLHAAYRRIVAEELSIDPSGVIVVLGDTDRTPWDMGTFGSMSVEMDGLELRHAAACVRDALLQRAAVRFAVDAAQLTLAGGNISAPDGRTVPLGALAAEGPIDSDIPDDMPFGVPRLTYEDSGADEFARDIVTGRATFVADVQIDGMLEGAVLHAPVFGAQLTSVDTEGAARMPGVVAVVHDGDFVGVVAETAAQARAARKAVQAAWRSRAAESTPSDAIALTTDPAIGPTLAAATTVWSAQYTLPHVAAAPLGPSVGVADVRADGATIYGTTQVPFRLREQVARLTGLAPERVHFKPLAMSGGFGRHGASDAAVEAARLSKAVRRPVRVQWTRADELHSAPHRAQMTATFDGALDESGRILGWRSHIQTNTYSYDAEALPARAPAAPPSPLRGVARAGWGSPEQMAAMMAGRNGAPPYEFTHTDVRLSIVPANIRTGALRSLGAAPNTFANETFMDELAAAANQDPIAFRLAHTSDPRLRRVLEAVRDTSGWTDSDPKRGVGVACVVYRKTYVAEVCEVSVDHAGVHLERVWCAVDAGHIVDLDGARNQIEGAIQMAASWALIETLAHVDGTVTASTWKDYPIATFRDAPRSIDIVFTGDDDTPSAGLGEPPAVPLGAAIANAIYRASGVRVRELPIGFHEGPRDGSIVARPGE